MTALERWTRAAPAALLAAEFVILDAAYFVGRPIGLDARIYLAAAREWLAGGETGLSPILGARARAAALAAALRP